MEHIKSVASTNISDMITIYADKHHDIIFRFILDVDEQQGPSRNKIPKSERARVYITTEIIRSS